jgi:hypothetical protein
MGGVWDWAGRAGSENLAGLLAGQDRNWNGMEWIGEAKVKKYSDHILSMIPTGEWRSPGLRALVFARVSSNIARCEIPIYCKLKNQSYTGDVPLPYLIARGYRKFMEIAYIVFFHRLNILHINRRNWFEHFWGTYSRKFHGEGHPRINWLARQQNLNIKYDI